MDNEKLVQLIRKGENKAENLAALYEGNKRLIYKITSSYRHFAEPEDLYQEAYFGLVEAVDQWDPERTPSFATYAARQIRWTLSRYCIKNGTALTVPENLLRKVYSYRRFLSVFEEEYSRLPTIKETAAGMKIRYREADRIRETEFLLRVASLDQSAAEGSPAQIDLLQDPDNSIDRLLDDMELDQRAGQLHRLLELIDPVEADILKRRFYAGQTLKECSQDLGLSVYAISERQKRGIYRLRILMQKEAKDTARNDHIESLALKNTSYSHYKNTFTSSVEKVVLDLLKEDSGKL